MKSKKKCPTCGRKFKGSSKYCTYRCAVPAMMESRKQLKKKEGPIYEKWKARLKASIERI